MIKYQDKKYNEIATRVKTLDTILNTKQEFSKVVEETKDKLNITLKFKSDLEGAKQSKMKLNFAAAQSRLSVLEAELAANLLQLEKYVEVEEQVNTQLKALNQWFDSVEGQEEFIAYNNINRDIIKNQKKAIDAIETVTPKAAIRKAPKY